MKFKKITIIGAGLVGSLWAILLRKNNYQVVIYEKRSDMRKQTADAGRSINLVITSRGLFGLEQAGLLKEALDLSVLIYGRMIHPKKGELAYQPYGQKNERNLSISRNTLNRFLLTAAEKAGAEIYFDHSLEEIDFEKRVTTFSHKNKKVEDTFELLFGADGSGSLVRKNLEQKYPESFQSSTEWLAAEYKELYLPAGSTLDRNALHIWPRGSHMMMALANLDRSFTVTLYLPKPGTYSFEQIKTESQVKAFFEEEFPDAWPLMPDYVKDYIQNAASSLGTVRCTKWTWQDSVALMGDAAHAIVPFFGQGMNSGFEDCTSLLEVMKTTDDWTEILKKYEQTQMPNANAIADMAIENWIEMSEKVGNSKFLLRKKIEAVLEKNFPNLFKSRYGMVTYTLIPYHLIKQAGVLQDDILTQLCAKIKSVEQLDMKLAEELLTKIYSPFLNENQIELKAYLG